MRNWSTNVPLSWQHLHGLDNPLELLNTLIFKASYWYAVFNFLFGKHSCQKAIFSIDPFKAIFRHGKQSGNQPPNRRRAFAWIDAEVFCLLSPNPQSRVASARTRPSWPGAIYVWRLQRLGFSHLHGFIMPMVPQSLKSSCYEGRYE